MAKRETPNSEAVWSANRTGFRERLELHLRRLDPLGVRYRALDSSV